VKEFNYNGSLERQFKVQDEVFTWRFVRPEEQTELAGILLAEDRDNDPAQQWVRMDRQIMLFLEEEDHERWRTLRARSENPVTIGQLIDIVGWLVEVQSDRPTEQPSPSSPGRGKTAASSKAE
jgi:hypothetical protein